MLGAEIVVKLRPVDANRYSGRERIDVEFSGNRVFTALRYDQFGVSKVHWRVDPLRDKVDYIKKLASFYETLKSGNQNKIDAGLIDDELEGIFFNKANSRTDYYKKKVSLGQLTGIEPRIVTHKKFTDFRAMKINTPYAIMILDDNITNMFSRLNNNGETGWEPENGLIAIVSHNDLSEPVAKLIEETARYPVPAERLQPVLGKMVYSFQ